MRKNFSLKRVGFYLTYLCFISFVWSQPGFQNPSEDLLSPYQLFHQPTPAFPDIKLLPEWTEHQAVMLSIPAKEVLKSPAMLTFYASLIKAIQEAVPVIIFSGEENFDHLPNFLEQLKKFGFSTEAVDEIIIFDAGIYSGWIRDFAPAFALDSSGKPVLIDPIYSKGFFDFIRHQGSIVLNNPDQPVQEFNQRLYASHPFSAEDKFPIELARFLRQKYGQATESVRPPLFFEGGDLVYNGEGLLLVSQRTLFLNGGNERLLTQLFKEYYGVDSVHYLRELPWNKVNHLDYVLKFTDPQTILVAEPYGELIETEYRRRVSRDAREAMAFNQAYININFPELKVIQVPFIAGARDSESDFLNHVLRRLYSRVAYQLGLISEEEGSQALDKLGQEEMLQIVSSIEKDTGFSDIKNPAIIDLVVSHYFSTSLAEFRSVYVDREFYFRSYLNSLYLKNAKGEERFILPRFRPKNGDEAKLIPEVEALVEVAYKKAKPAAEIVWVDCDVIASQNGTIHCVTQVLPKWEGYPGKPLLN